MSAQINNIRPEFDREIVDIVDYVMNYEISSKVAYDTAHYCLLDTLGCGLEALEYPACKKLLGPVVPGTVVPNGVRVPGTQFQLDPVIKEESIWLSGQHRRPSSQLMKRKNQAVFLNNVHHEKVTHSGTLYENESVFGQLGEPHLYPEVSQMRESLRNWRFYHEFSVSSGSAIRAPQVGFRSPVLASDGANLAAAFQTIVEIGDELLLMRILDQAFPGCVFYSDNTGGRFRMMMQREGLSRPLEPAEFSDGTLRFLCLAVALLSPRPPAFIALNEPENSLHPQMLPALASLIAEASRYSQIWLTSHSPELAKLIEKQRSFSLYELSMAEGETRVERLG